MHSCMHTARSTSTTYCSIRVLVVLYLPVYHLFMPFGQVTSLTRKGRRKMIVGMIAWKLPVAVLLAVPGSFASKEIVEVERQLNCPNGTMHHLASQIPSLPPALSPSTSMPTPTFFGVLGPAPSNTGGQPSLPVSSPEATTTTSTPASPVTTSLDVVVSVPQFVTAPTTSLPTLAPTVKLSKVPVVEPPPVTPIPTLAPTATVMVSIDTGFPTRTPTFPTRVPTAPPTQIPVAVSTESPVTAAPFTGNDDAAATGDTGNDDCFDCFDFISPVSSPARSDSIESDGTQSMSAETDGLGAVPLIGVALGGLLVVAGAFMVGRTRWMNNQPASLIAGEPDDSFEPDSPMSAQDSLAIDRFNQVDEVDGPNNANNA